MVKLENDERYKPIVINIIKRRPNHVAPKRPKHREHMRSSDASICTIYDCCYHYLNYLILTLISNFLGRIFIKFIKFRYRNFIKFIVAKRSG